MSNDAMLKRAKEVVVDFYVGREMEYDKTQPSMLLGQFDGWAIRMTVYISSIVSQILAE